MFLALKNGLGRLAVFFRGLFDEYGGAAAAYSLRRLGSAYSGPLVRVRRDSDDAELDFTSTTLIEDWVNGKQETTLPADVATSSAAYSLRKVKDTYTGDAVRIRRESDDVEVNVAFDTTGVVSANSAITNVTESPDQGDTTATTLGGFLTESVNTYTSDYSAGVDGWTTTGDGNLAGDIDGIGGRDDNLRFTSTVSDIDVFSYHRRNNVLELGQKYNVTFDFYIPSSNSRLDQIKEIVFGGQTINLSSFTALDQWVSVSVTNTTGATTNLILIRWEDSSESGDATGDVAYIRNVSINAVGHNAYVQTWYDQAGSNDATQNTSGDQPKIAEAGALLADGIDFDGSSSNLDMPSVISSVALASSFVVAKASNVSQTGIAIALSRNNPDQRWYAPAFISGTSYFGYGDSASKINLGATDTNEHLFSAIADSSNATAFLDATSKGSTAVFTGTGLLTSGGIGAVNDTSFYEGSIKEIVVYNSDQSSNRFKIESNINNYYGIYTASHNGFVETWYDQSGNGNDAEQLTLGDQPKIVSNGSLLADGIDFDGVSDFFTASGVSTTQPYSVFMKIKASETGAVQQIFDSGSVDPAFFQFSTAGVLSINNPTSTVTSLDLTSTPTDVLISGFIDDPKTAFADGASILSPAAGTGTNSLSGLTIGKHRSLSSNYYGGNFSELIIYDSDQSANRSGIESNIADHYGITLP